ncbi:MAG: hypothetical protein ACRCXZ_01385 [Patescibacteria group bacterium]
MSLEIVGSYYQPRLEKLGFDLYKLITYLPFRLEVISPFFDKEANSFFVTGVLIDINDKGKFSVLTIQTRKGNQMSFYDFGKKSLYQKLRLQSTYQVLFTKKDNYNSVQEIAIFEGLTTPQYELGKLENKIYYRPVYNLINYQIRSKQINKIISNLPSSIFRLNLEGLVPPNQLIPQILDLEPIHKPDSLENYNQAVRNWNNFQAFLNLVFLQNMNIEIVDENTKINPMTKGIIDEYENKLNIELSKSQKSVIKNILKNITF